MYAEYFSQVLSYLYENKVDTTIVISPIHARFMEVIHRAGFWQDYSSWKKTIVLVNESLSETYKVKGYDIFDAAIYNEYSMEEIKPKTSATWYFESSHATPAYGDKILDQILLAKSGVVAVQLTSENIDEHLEAQSKKRESYIENNAAQIKHLISGSSEGVK